MISKNCKSMNERYEKYNSNGMGYSPPNVGTQFPIIIVEIADIVNQMKLSH